MSPFRWRNGPPTFPRPDVQKKAEDLQSGSLFRLWSSIQFLGPGPHCFQWGILVSLVSAGGLSPNKKVWAIRYLTRVSDSHWGWKYKVEFLNESGEYVQFTSYHLMPLHSSRSSVSSSESFKGSMDWTLTLIRKTQLSNSIRSFIILAIACPFLTVYSFFFI